MKDKEKKEEKRHKRILAWTVVLEVIEKLNVDVRRYAMTNSLTKMPVETREKAQRIADLLNEGLGGVFKGKWIICPVIVNLDYPQDVEIDKEIC